MKKFTTFILLLTFFSSISSVKKIWKGSTSFENAKSWKNQIPPSKNCSNQVIKFPVDLYAPVIVGDNIDASELILSENGGLLLSSDVSITLTNKVTQNDQKCDKEVVFAPPRPAKWFSAGNWEAVFDEKDQKYNKATPDTHKIPCEDDFVVFPNDSTILVDLNFAPYLNFHAINLNGKTYKEDFKEFLNSELGSLMFVNSLATTVNVGKCSDGHNCVCEHQNYLCDDVNCDEKGAFCVDPIQPKGFCCKLCGSFIEFEVSPHFNVSTFLRSVDKTLSFSSLDKKSVEYFAAFSSKNSLQLVVVDKEAGNEMHGPIASYLKQNLIDKMFKTQFLFQQSGMSYVPGTNNVFSFIFVTFLVVAAFLGAFYVYHYEDRSISNLLAMLRNRQLPTGSQFIFARFDNQRTDETVDIDVVQIVEDEDDEKEDEVKPSSFNNPLYDDKSKFAVEDNSETSVSNEETEMKETTAAELEEVDLLGPNEE
ncbi:protein amnionless [Culicoides brevitarsis]|uniref:protein amnionless n=1 Tax=Culicoides brevitarsis TaxID=469753 RepID=UPI00307B5D3E